jgi:hypothetical protein
MGFTVPLGYIKRADRRAGTGTAVITYLEELVARRALRHAAALSAAGHEIKRKRGSR